jgi:hypoxanthine phosphoribosyltransferase
MDVMNGRDLQQAPRPVGSHAVAMEADIRAILFTREQIQSRVRELAAEIVASYGGEERGLTLVPVLSGAIIFLADLIRELPLKMKIALVQISTYPGATTTAGQPEALIELTGEVRGRHVLVVDDIFDTGRTLRRVHAMIRARQPASLRTAVLLRKPAKAPPDIIVDFVGFDVDDLFVVGYGLDYDDHYRNFPHIGVLRPELMP